jgi:hypothetical protein
LRIRQLSIEQIQTYEHQRAAAEKLQTLNDAQAHATMQTQLSNSKVQIQIVENQGEAELARARKQADAELARAERQAQQIVVMAQADLDRAKKQAEQTVLTAQAESQQRVLAGRGEGSRLMQVGLSEASVLLRKIQSFGDPRLFALISAAQSLARSTQPLVPQRMFVAGQSSNGSPGTPDPSSQGLLGLLISLLVAEKSGFDLSGSPGTSALEEYADRLTREAMESVPPAAGNELPPARPAIEPKGNATPAKPAAK